MPAVKNPPKCFKCLDFGHTGPDMRYCDCPKGQALKQAIYDKWND